MKALFGELLFFFDSLKQGNTMNNKQITKKIMKLENAWAPVFDADRRKVQFTDDLSVLENVGAQLNAYGLHENDVLTFPEKIQIGIQDPRRENQRPSYLVSCYVNGQKTYINPMFFLRNKREDGHNVPIYPKWAALGDAKAVIAKLIEMKTLKAGKNMRVQMADFNADGSAKMIPQLNEKGEVVVNNDGSVVNVRATRTAEYPSIPDPIA